MKRIIPLLFLISACSARVQAPEALKPSWLKTQPYRDGYYTGIGHSQKDGTNNYIQSAKKSALDDLVSQIKVNVSSTSVLSFFEADKKIQEQYEQIIKTTVADELQEFELVDAWEDADNYWVYYQLSIARYRQIKEEQKQKAIVQALDFFIKGLNSEKAGEQIPAIRFYFQAFRSMEKYLGESIRCTIEGREILLVNEIYASIQKLLNDMQVHIYPGEILLNRRLTHTEQKVTAKVSYKNKVPAVNMPLIASFEKGEGEIFPEYNTNEAGEARILISKISSREIDQTVGVKVNLDALSGAGSSPVYTLMAKTFHAPGARLLLKVQRPVVFLTADEKSLGFVKSNLQISNKLKNLLANNGFEFTENKSVADLWFDIQADSEKGSVSGSIYITYLTGIIKVTTMKEGKEIYAATLDRVRGYGLDYDKSSIDAYNKALESLERDRMKELLNTVLQ